MRLPAPFADLTGRLVGRGADLVHRLDLRIPARAPREVLTVHDLPPLRFDDEGHLPDHAFVSARRAACVVCPSEFAAAEVRDLLGATRVRVVPNGVDPVFWQAVPADADELAALGIRRPFVLHAAGATRRKNLEGLASAWSRVRAAVPDVGLVLCGPPHPNRLLALGSQPGAVLTGRLDPATVAGLMKVAACVVVPSIYEGFGLPVLEAQAVGTPVVASDRGALREVSGGHAVLTEPDSESLAEGILRALAFGPAVQANVEAGRRWASNFTWARAARSYLEIYAAALA